MSNTLQWYETFSEYLKKNTPSIIETSSKKTFNKCCIKTMFLHFALEFTPMKMLHYKDFAAYIKPEHNNPGSILDNKMKKMSDIISKTKFSYTMPYPLYEFISNSIYRESRWNSPYEGIDSDSDLNKDNLIFYSHSPILLYYIIKEWSDLPHPGTELSWKDIKGIKYIYSDFQYYYERSNTGNKLVATYLMHKCLGIDYFIKISDDFLEFTTDAFIEESVVTTLIKIICLLRFMPGTELSEMFYQILMNKIKKNTSYNKLSAYLLTFSKDILLFLWNINTSFKSSFYHCLTNTTNKHNETEEKFYLPLINLQQLIQMIIDTETPDKTRLKLSLKKLDQLMSKNPEGQLWQLYTIYYSISNPYQNIERIIKRYGYSAEKACEVYARDFLQ